MMGLGGGAGTFKLSRIAFTSTAPAGYFSESSSLCDIYFFLRGEGGGASGAGIFYSRSLSRDKA